MLPFRNLIAGTQLVSIGATALILYLKLNLSLGPQQVESLGGMLSTGIIAVGLINHFQAKRGKPLPFLLVLLGVFAPVYAYVAGPSHYLFGFHAVALGVHSFVLKLIADSEKAKET